MDLQSLINSGSSKGMLELPPGEFFGQIIIRRPITISGKGKSSWIGSKTGPTIKIASRGVKLQNMIVEVTTGANEVAIEAQLDANPLLENVVIRGRVVGVPIANITTRAIDKEPDSQPVSLLPPPPRLSNLGKKQASSPAPTLVQAAAPPIIQPVGVPTEPAPELRSESRWPQFVALGITVLVLALVVALHVFNDRAKVTERAKNADKVAAIEKEIREKQMSEKEREIEKLREAEKLRAREKEKRDEEEKLERARALDLENRDRRTREWVQRREGARVVREKVKGRLKFLSEFWEQQKSKMTLSYGAFAGNVLEGNTGFAGRSSPDEATKAAFQNCEKNGGGCEELYMLNVFNDTAKAVTIYLYHPWEPHLEKSNSPFFWSLAPGKDTFLAMDGNRLLVTKRFYMHVTCPGGQWGPQPLDLYNCRLIDGSDGKALRIRLVETGD